MNMKNYNVTNQYHVYFNVSVMFWNIFYLFAYLFILFHE